MSPRSRFGAPPRPSPGRTVASVFIEARGGLPKAAKIAQLAREHGATDVVEVPSRDEIVLDCFFDRRSSALALSAACGELEGVSTLLGSVDEERSA